MTLPGFEGVADHNAHHRPADHYPTPAKEAALLVEVLRQRVPPSKGWVLEAGCGHGAVVAPAAEAGYHVIGLDVRQEAIDEVRSTEVQLRTNGIGAIRADFMTWEPGQWWRDRCAAAVGNPPFWGDSARLLAWLDRLFTFAPVVVQLLPTSFLHTSGRAAWHRQHPCDVFPLDERPAFMGQGGKAECSIMVWPPINGMHGQIFRVGEVYANPT